VVQWRAFIDEYEIQQALWSRDKPRTDKPAGGTAATTDSRRIGTRDRMNQIHARVRLSQRCHSTSGRRYRMCRRQPRQQCHLRIGGIPKPSPPGLPQSRQGKRQRKGQRQERQASKRGQGEQGRQGRQGGRAPDTSVDGDNAMPLGPAGQLGKQCWANMAGTCSDTHSHPINATASAPEAPPPAVAAVRTGELALPPFSAPYSTARGVLRAQGAVAATTPTRSVGNAEARAPRQPRR
jgi:hypothetical protein